MAESEEELKSLLMKVKEESEKSDLKLNIQKMKIMASSPIALWQIDRETMETEILFSWAPKWLQMVTAAMKLKNTCFLEESYDQPSQHIKKQSHYFTNKGLSRASLMAQLVKNPPSGDLGSIPGLERSPREGKGYPLQYPGLENSMNCIVHGVAKSRAQLSNFHSHF